MLRNHLIIALRNIRRNIFYSLINTFGLAIGLSACLLIALFVIDEFGFDQYNVNASRIYRVEADVKFGESQFRQTFRGAPEAHSMMQEYPEIESTVRFRSRGSYLVKQTGGKENVRENNVIWTDSTFFKIFSVHVLEGDPATALTQPSSIAISKKLADKYFPQKSALGESMILDNKYNAIVTAVYEDIPAASHFHFDILISMVGDWPGAQEAQSQSYMNENFITYLLLKEGADPKVLQSKLPGFLEKYIGPQLAQALGGNLTMKKFLAQGNRYDLTLRPLGDIHLHSDLNGEFEANGNIVYVYLLSTIALLILCIACINFMNLSTARSSQRAREVGVRKMMGSKRSHLIRQFLTESMLVTFFSIVLALGLVLLFLPEFNKLTLKSLQLPFNSLFFYFLLTGATIFIGLAAGIYPSFFLSAFKPIQVLKGNTFGSRSGTVRSTLVVFQFVISTILIIGTITVKRQLQFIKNKETGFQKDHIVVVHDAYALGSHAEAFKNEVLRLTNVESGTISGYVPVLNDGAWRNSATFWKEGVQPTPGNVIAFQSWDVDLDYLNTYRMKIVKGRGFARELISDSSAVVLNETAVARLGLGVNPVGQLINKFIDGEGHEQQIKQWTVIGVVEDFHFSSMKETISPLALFLSKNAGSMSFRISAADKRDVIESIEKAWKQFDSGQPFQYSFLDVDYAKTYQAEGRLERIFVLFAELAIIIACLGLFALTAYTAEQRTKEIGIRKVLGASVGGIVILLSKHFGRLILISVVISIPAAWYGVNKWLQGYAYKAEIGVEVYLIAGTFAVLVALGTISFQSIKAAVRNPVETLRAE